MTQCYIKQENITAIMISMTVVEWEECNKIFSTVILEFLNKYGSNLIQNTLYVSAAQ